MKIAIICSTEDKASMTIRKCLLELYDFGQTSDTFEGKQILQLSGNKDVRLYTTDTPPVDCENLGTEIEADLFIFATKHKAKSGIPSLSVHTQGNWGEAGLGGKDRQLAVSPANYLKEGLKKLAELSPALQAQGFDIIQECTHHGPFLSKPSMFIEIGSSEPQWENQEAGKIIAETIHHLATKEPPHYKVAVGIGGPHHTPNFKKIILGGEIAVGHVCPKYQLENLDKEMVLQAVERSWPKAELIILDWKGIDSKERITKILAEIGIETKKTKEF